MKFLLKLLFLVISLVAIVLIVAFFVDGKYTVTRSVEINAPKSVIFEYISQLENQQDYSVWHKRDPNILIETTGTDGMVGFVTSWKSQLDDLGSGEQEIIQIIDDERLITEIRFKQLFEGTSISTIELHQLNSNLCKVSWSFDGENPYPFNAFSLFMNMEDEIGPDLAAGLKNLKKILESQNN